MSTFSFIEATEWHCVGCDRPLVPTPVKVSYLHSVFNVELMACPGGGFVYVPESLALGKMLEVDKLLEDK